MYNLMRFGFVRTANWSIRFGGDRFPSQNQMRSVDGGLYERSQRSRAPGGDCGHARLDYGDGGLDAVAPNT